MWTPGHHCPEVNLDNFNQDLVIDGDLEREEASEWLVKFLSRNPSFATPLLIGKEMGTLYPIQDMIIKSWFLRDFNLIVAGRGFSKSYMASLFIVLYALFNPGTKIIICAGAFRQSKGIFEKVEEFIRKSPYLKKCLSRNPKHGTDCYEMELGSTSIKALPLTEKIRGFRCNLAIIDEYLNVPQKIINEVILPFLSVQRANGARERRIREGEEILIAKGRMKESERTKFPRNKLLGLSSATYQCEPLYKEVYLKYIEIITDPNTRESVSHSLWRLSYEAAPKNFLDERIIDEAKRTLSKQQFDKEFRALFPNDSGGFFDIKNIIEAQIPPGASPRIKLKGDSNKKYIMGIDPTFSAGSEEADDFAIVVLELDDETQAGTLVHAYAMPKSNVKNRALYFQYLFNYFNIVFVSIDNAGGPKFIEEVLALLPHFPRKLKIMEEAYFDTPEEVMENRSKYNPASDKIVNSIVFQRNMWKRTANESLQADLQHKKVFFGSRCTFSDASENLLDFNINLAIPINELEFKELDDNLGGEAKQYEFCQHLDFLVEKTKTELSFIEMTSTSDGSVQFNLPQSLKRKKGPDRPRRDLYTALLLANWGRRCYYRIMEQPEESGYEFMPILFGSF